MPVRAIQRDGLAIMTRFSLAFCFLFRFLLGVGHSVRKRFVFAGCMYEITLS